MWKISDGNKNNKIQRLTHGFSSREVLFLEELLSKIGYSGLTSRSRASECRFCGTARRPARSDPASSPRRRVAVIRRVASVPKIEKNRIGKTVDNNVV